MELLEDFEDNLNDWTQTGVGDISLNSTGYSGSTGANLNHSNYSYEDGLFEIAYYPITAGKHYSFSFWYYETSDNQNGGLGLYSNGSLVIGAGTNNPQFSYNNGSFTEASSGQDYGKWTKVTFDFDWSSETVDIRWDQGTDEVTESNLSLATVGKIDSIRVGHLKTNGSTYDFWIDNIKYDPKPQPILIDGESVSDATIDGTNINQITMDGDYIWSQPQFYGFETGDFSNWVDTNGCTVSSNKSYDSTYACSAWDAQSSTYQAKAIPFDGGAQVSKVSFNWLETTNSYGGGIRLMNSNGNMEFGFATDNPEWYINDNGGMKKIHDGNSNYDDWHKVIWTLDWGNSQYDVYIENLATGYSENRTGYTIRNGVNVESVLIEDANYANWRDGGNIDMWFDNIKVTL